MANININDAISAYNRVSNNATLGGIGGDDKSGKTDESGFASLLRAGIDKAVDTQYKSEKVSADAIMGKASMTDVIQAVNDAEVTLQTVIAVRDKIIDAYQRIMQMPV